MRTSLAFSDEGTAGTITSKILPIKFKEIDSHVVRSALNCFSSFNYNNLKSLYPQLKSVKEFVTSDDYLANISIKVIGTEVSIDKYTQAEKLQIAKSVLKELEPMLITRGKTYRGTKAFSPHRFKDKFRDTIQLNVTITPNSNKEFGVSMRTPREPKYALDLLSVNWYAYNDNYGTSEEKALVKYIEVIMPRLEEKYDEIYLVRNEKDIKIYSFDTGQAFEPDFLLFLRIKGSANKYDNLQLFIEPKGDGLLKQDKWKNDFLKQIKSMSEVSYCTQTDDFHVWGIPFFNESTNAEFEKALNEDVLEYVVEELENQSSRVLLSSSEVPERRKYVDFLPVYSLRAACGYFEDSTIIPDEEAEGWVNITNAGIKANKNMFVIYASGDSMQPKINDGDLCVFEIYNTGHSGSREGEIVLTECPDRDTDTDCHYTIKKYHSEKVVTEEGWKHTKIELIPLNRDYTTIVLDEDCDYRTIGIFKCAL